MTRMSEAPKLSGGSMRIDLRGLREGTHPVVLEGREAPLTLDRTAGRILRRFRFELPAMLQAPARGGMVPF